MAASVRMRNTLTLFSSVDDVLCHRVRLVLAAKGVTYDLVPVDAQNPPEDLIHLNPYHSVPTLVERELVLYAASVVSEYLDERYPHPPLMPVDPLSRARLRLAMLRIEHDWVPQVQAIQRGLRQPHFPQPRLHPQPHRPGKEAARPAGLRPAGAPCRAATA